MTIRGKRELSEMCKCTEHYTSELCTLPKYVYYSAVILKTENITQFKNEDALSMHGAWVWSLDGEQNSHMLCGMVKKVLKDESWIILQEKKVL